MFRYGPDCPDPVMMLVLEYEEMVFVVDNGSGLLHILCSGRFITCTGITFQEYAEECLHTKIMRYASLRL